MTPRQPVRLTEGMELFVDLDRRPRKEAGARTGHVAIYSCGRGWRFYFSIAEVLDGGRRVFEVVLHYVGAAADERCVVARFTNRLKSQLAVPVLGDVWLEEYIRSASAGNQERFTPCRN